VHEEEGGDEHLTIVATGSEVSIALEAASKLRAQRIKARVVSLPCWLVFDQQPPEYRLRVLRSGAPILSLEALSVRDQFGVPRVGGFPDEEITDRWLGAL
jgi:transketolase